MNLFDQAINFLTDPRVFFLVSIVLFVASIQFAEVWTKPKVAAVIALLLVVFVAYATTKYQVAKTLKAPDNIPIVIVLASLGFLYWLAMRQAVQNDARIDSGQPPKEAAEKNRKVHDWPDLVYTELIAMVVCTVVLVAWSLLIRAPLEPPANSARTPNPSKAPWYFLGLQELLKWFHPMVAGVMLPGMALVGLILAPYTDRNPSNKPEDRKFAISLFTLFLVFWAVLVLIGTFFRGPGFNFIFPWNIDLFVEL